MAAVTAEILRKIMQRIVLAALAVALVLIGPAMFVFSRAAALDAAFARVRGGQSGAQVQKLLGRPDAEVALAPQGGGVLEYEYRVWPLRGVWAVELRRGRVVAARRRTGGWLKLRSASQRAPAG